MSDVPSTWKREREAAVQAVRAAARLTTAVQGELAGRALDKQDRSPVTIADFGSQALVCRALQQSFADDPVVGEEDTAQIAVDEHAGFRRDLTARVATALGQAVDEAQVLSWIDRGRSDPGPRFWTIDPVDGTKGFVRGAHYAIALALIEDGQPVVAALACPHLELTPDTSGLLLVAVTGAGTELLPLVASASVASEPGRVSTHQDAADVRLVESVESGHSDHSWSASVSDALGIVCEPVRLDSQAKYGVVARGQADLYLRLPTRPGYQEKIWDHAAGALVVTEAGGRVTDLQGRALDFGCGRTLANNRGVVASNGLLHDRILAVVDRVGAVQA